MPARERLAGATGTALVLALIGYGLLAGLRIEGRAPLDEALTVLNLAAPPPPPEPPPHPPRQATRVAGKAAPANLRGKAAAIVAPPVALPLPTPLVVAPQPDLGMERVTGAGDRAGLGTGAGGIGDGMGGGGDGRGSGDEPPRFLHGRLRYGDLPPALRAAAVSGSVGVRYSVDVTGRVGDCVAIGSSGNAELDAVTCRLIEQRFRYHPSRTADGRPVRSTIEESHSWIVDPTLRPDDDRP